MSFAKGTAISLQSRDVALLRSLFECRVMTTAHISAIHFHGKREATKKRLQSLKAAGYLTERERRVNEPAVLFLTWKALKLLKTEGVLAEYPPLSLLALEKRARVSDLTIRHELAVMDIKAAWHTALRGSKRFSIAEFGTWPRLYQFEARRRGFGPADVTVRPDGFVHVQEQKPDGSLSEHYFFLEVDRSTETQDTLVSRAGCYLDYYKSGGFAVRCGAARSAFKDYPFRVLIVCKSAERRNNTAERLLQHNPTILTQVCLTTLDEVKVDPLGMIWIRPLDYREATNRASGAASSGPTSRPDRDPTRRHVAMEYELNKLSLFE